MGMTISDREKGTGKGVGVGGGCAAMGPLGTPETVSDGGSQSPYGAMADGDMEEQEEAGMEGMTRYHREPLRDLKENYIICLYFQKERYDSRVEDEPKRSGNEEKAMESKDNLASRTDKTG